MLAIVYLQRCNGDLFTMSFLPFFVALFIIIHAVYLSIDTRRLLLFFVVVYHTSKSTDNTFNRRLTSPSLSLSLSVPLPFSMCLT